VLVDIDFASSDAAFLRYQAERWSSRMDGQLMREQRLMLRLSQSELKDALNARFGRSYDKPKISRWENGREPIPQDVAAGVAALVAGRPRDARTIVLANQKGGVGKTTSALNLAYALARGNRHVLLVDMDPQATATVGLLAEHSVEAYRQGRTMTSVILGSQPIRQIIITQSDPVSPARALPFDLAASHIDLAETDGRREPGFDAMLREALDPVRAEYDYIVIDAPPNLGMLNWMALAAAEDVIIPVRTEPYDAMGVGLILGTINKVQRRLNPALRLAGILPTQFGRRKSVDREVLAHLVQAMGDKAPVLEPVPESAVFGHAARNGRIALEASPTAPATLVYARLADAIVAGVPLPRADMPALVPDEMES
jgi:chromosome partitioning protein